MQIKVNNRDLRLDEEGNVLDAHDGTLEFFEGHFYWYGTTSEEIDRWPRPPKHISFIYIVRAI